MYLFAFFQKERGEEDEEKIWHAKASTFHRTIG